MTRPPRWLRDAIVAAAIVLGMVGMHHLVILACHHVPISAVTALVTSDHGTHVAETHPASPAPEQNDDFAATCLAVLAMTGVLLLGARSVVARLDSPSMTYAMRTWIARALPPPDLAVLSVSRT